MVDETRLLGLLVQSIARETVQEFGGLPGVAGDVFSHDFMSTWEWASDLLVELSVATPVDPGYLSTKLQTAFARDLILAKRSSTKFCLIGCTAKAMWYRRRGARSCSNEVH
ncbi:hypothetical protein [Sinorhizobium sp. Sb3]|uniref:hypothetical protein n=1 Tax=Sinorhizobium sp. Sb3 TaxID=1358417 RepID=UPI000AEF7545|nr:hypothetical protein [Sinorhizobium sp. Sb3]